jgi:3-hydroxyacyl-[acyl-carrier-protein] dehydratase
MMTTLETTEPQVKLDARACRALLPHRDVMALLDGVKWYRPQSRHLLGYKRIATSEFACRGYFPRQPMFPPTLVIEVLAQTCGIMMNMERLRDQSGVDLLRLEDPSYITNLPPIPLSVLADSTIKQHTQVFPGDTLELEVKLTIQRQEFRYFNVSARTDGNLVANGSILLSYPNYLDFEH